MTSKVRFDLVINHDHKLFIAEMVREQARWVERSRFGPYKKIFYARRAIIRREKQIEIEGNRE